MKSKAEIQRERRKRLASEGLVRVEVYVPPATRGRLERYVESLLSGRVSKPRRKKPQGG